MKAAILNGPKDFRVEDVSDPELDPDGIIVRVKACGVCGSELPMYQQGSWPDGRVHPIEGHEWCGEVVEVGTNITGIRLGDRVTQMRRYEGFAEYIAITDLDRVLKLPNDMPYEVGATLEPLGVSVYVATEAQPTLGDTVAVLGAGMIGQGVWQAFRAMGVSKVIVTDVAPKRLEAAKALGADVVINAAEEDPVERIKEITAGSGADIVVDAAGFAGALQQAFDMARGRPPGPATPGGKVMLAASYFQPAEVMIQPRSVLTKNIRLIGCVGSRMKEALDLMRAGRINTKPLVTHRFPLDQINEAFEAAAKRDEVIKVVVEP